MLIFTACEKEEAINSSSPAENSIDVKSKTQNQKSTVYTEAELKDLLEDSDPETAYRIREVSGGYEMEEVTYDSDEIGNPPNPEGVYVFPDQWDEAWAEAVQMSQDTGCWVTLTFGYGLVAVNLAC